MRTSLLSKSAIAFALASGALASAQAPTTKPLPDSPAAHASAQSHYNLGVSLSNKGDIDGAMREYREALRLQPDYFDALENLGLLLVKKGDLNGAIKEHETAVHLRPED